MENYSYNDENIENLENEVNSPSCNIVCSKCLGELLGIFLYIVVCALTVITSITTLGAGKPYTCAYELLIVFVIDQVKSIPM